MATVKGVWTFSNVSYYSSEFVYAEVTGTTTFFEANYGLSNAAFTGIAVLSATGGNMARFDGISGYSNGLNAWPAIMEGQTVDFGETEQTVPDAFYTWLTSNATSASSAPSEETYYQIGSTRLKGFADQARRLGNVSGELTPAQIEETLNGVTVGGSISMFVSSAVGILPTVYTGTANSEFTLEFESSAVGALSE